MKYIFCIFLLFHVLGYKVFSQKKDICLSCEQKKKALLQKSTLTRVLIIFDASNSMSGKWNNQTKIEIAKSIAIRLIDSLSKVPNVQMALRVYGASVKYPPGDCKDSRLVIPFQFKNQSSIKQYIQQLKPTGITPIEYTLIQAASDFPDNSSLNNIIIITDGIEECKGDPCKGRKYLEEQGIIFKPFIIGIGLDVQQANTFQCVGQYYDVQDNTLIQQISDIITQQKLNKTTLQVNLLDIAGRPLETNVNITFYDNKRNTYLYNYIHSLNEINNPDTLILPSHIQYKVVAHTIPPTQSDAIKLNEGHHNIIPISAPQGALFIQREKGNFNFNEKIRAVVRGVENKTIYNVQNLNSLEKYIIGHYELTILTLPKISQRIEITPVKTLTISIPSAGELQIQSLEAGDGSILLQKDNGQLEWVCNLSTQTQQTFYLLPGKYKVVWRPKSMRSSIYTIQKEVVIKPHQSYLLKLY